MEVFLEGRMRNRRINGLAVSSCFIFVIAMILYKAIRGREEGIREGMALGIEQGIERGIRCMIEALQETGQTEAYIMEKIAEKYSLSETEAQEKLLRYLK